MKYFMGVLALVGALFSGNLANAAAVNLNNATMQDIQFNFNRSSPGAMQKFQLGTIIAKRNMFSVKATYNFAVSGGAISTIKLLDTNTGLPLVLPKSAIVRSCIIDVITAPVGASATIALGTGQTAVDLLAATAITSYAIGLHTCIPVGTAATAIKLTADVNPSMTIATTALTAGLFNVMIDFDMSE